MSVGVLHGGSNFYVCGQILRCDHSNKNLFVRTFTYMGFFVLHHFTQQSLKIFTLARLEKSNFCFQVLAGKQPVHNNYTYGNIEMKALELFVYVENGYP